MEEESKGTIGSTISILIIIGLLFSIVILRSFAESKSSTYGESSLAPTKGISLPSPPETFPATSTDPIIDVLSTTTSPLSKTASIIIQKSTAIFKNELQVKTPTSIVRQRGVSPSPTITLPITSTTQASTLNFSDIEASDRQSLVNIFCVTGSQSGIRSITGSGMIIDKRGIILTNAHIGQYLLLQNFLPKNTINCTIRTGSPAREAYGANILYLSPTWIKLNYKDIIETNPIGTGEDDFALLYITGSTIPGRQLPNNFPAINIDTSDGIIKIGEQVLALGYPAGFLGAIAINQDLYAVTSVATVGDVFTFKKDTLDLFSIGGSPVAQKGSSGGGVINQRNGKLSGLIVTTSEADTTSTRDLRAITLSHIDRGIRSEEGVGLTQFLEGDLSMKVLSFYQNKATDLIKLLVTVINENK